MKDFSVEKIAFAASLLVLTWMYGFATSAQGWFPNDLLVRAWDQGQALVARSVGMPRADYLQSRVHGDSGMRQQTPGEMQPGLTLVLSLWSDFDWNPGLKLIDDSGQTVHAWEVNPEELFPDPPDHRTRRVPSTTNVHGSYLFPNGDVLVNVSYIGVARLDACGRPIWTLTGGNHHSIERSEDGTFWVTGGSWKPSVSASEATDPRPGLPRSVYHDRLFHITEDGEVLEELDLLEIIYRNDLQRYIAKGSAYPPDGKLEDITHLNDIEPLPPSLADEYPLFEAGDLMVSIRHLDLVLVVDPGSLRVKWYASDPFIQQHDPDFLGDGWIGVFDNNRDGTHRGAMLGGNRIVFIQPHTDSIRIRLLGSRSEPFYTDVQGEWQKLNNGNLLLTESQTGRVVEMTEDGRTVWDWVVDPYSEEKVPEVSDAIRYALTRADVASWPCSAVDSADPREEVRS